MDSFEVILDNLYENAKTKLFDLVIDHGEESDHVSEKVLKITDDEFMFNLEGGRYLTEFHHHYGLIDNNGHQYSIYSLDSEQFFQVVDYLIKIYNQKRSKK